MFQKLSNSAALRSNLSFPVFPFPPCSRFGVFVGLKRPEGGGEIFHHLRFYVGQAAATTHGCCMHNLPHGGGGAALLMSPALRGKFTSSNIALFANQINLKYPK